MLCEFAFGLAQRYWRNNETIVICNFLLSNSFVIPYVQAQIAILTASWPHTDPSSLHVIQSWLRPTKEWLP